MEALYYDYLEMWCAVKKRYLHKVVDFIVDTALEMLTDVDNRLFTAYDIRFLKQFKRKDIKQTLYSKTNADDKGASDYARLLLDLFQVVKRLSYEDQIIVCENFERLKLHDNFRNHQQVHPRDNAVEQEERQKRVFKVVLKKHCNN